MTTSGVTAFSLTARQIVTIALQENAILAAGADPTATELDDCVLRLNAMLKSWQARGVTMWQESTEEVTIPAGDASIALPAGVSEVQDARFVYSSTYERPMAQYVRAQYMSLPNKAQSGDPVAYYVTSDAVPTLYVWPVPTTDATIRLEVSRITETVTDAAQTIDIPEMWAETVYSCLAVRIAGIFGQEPGSELVVRAQALEVAMLDYNRPASYYMRARRA